jgi:hypothetical protein
MNTVSVRQAIIRAKFTVIIPAAAAIILGLCLSVMVVMRYHEEPWPFVGCFIASIVLGWLYWSVAITHWRIWAFENVRNVHDLKRNAIRAKIIWSDKSFAEKTEIRTVEQRERLHKIARKFDHEDVYHDDLSIPKETRIGYSRISIFFGLFVLPVLGLGFGIYLYIKEGNYYLLPVAAALSIFLIYQSAKKALSKKAIIILNESGIQLQGLPFLNWDDVTHAEVVFEQRGKYQQHLLVVGTHIHFGKVDIGELDTNFEKLEHLIRVYRIRFEKQHLHRH